MPAFSFDISGMAVSDLAILDDVFGIDVHFPSAEWDDLGFVTDLFARLGRVAEIVIFESKSAVRSHVRTYKGLFASHRPLKEGYNVEVEVDLQNGLTHLVGLARINTHNAETAASLLRDGSRAFAILRSTDSFIDRAAVAAMLDAVPNLPGSAHINYARMVAIVAEQGDWLLRFAGYSGDGDSDVQLFVPSKDIVSARGLVEGTLASQEY